MSFASTGLAGPYLRRPEGGVDRLDLRGMDGLLAGKTHLSALLRLGGQLGGILEVHADHVCHKN